MDAVAGGSSAANWLLRPDDRPGIRVQRSALVLSGFAIARSLLPAQRLRRSPVARLISALAGLGAELPGRSGGRGVEADPPQLVRLGPGRVGEAAGAVAEASCACREPDPGNPEGAGQDFRELALTALIGQRERHVGTARRRS